MQWEHYEGRTAGLAAAEKILQVNVGGVSAGLQLTFSGERHA